MRRVRAGEKAPGGGRDGAYDGAYARRRVKQILIRYPLPPGRGFATRGDYRNQAYRLYAEYGVTSHWTVTAATAVERARTRGDGRIVQQTGLSDLTVQLKRRISAAPVVIAVVAEAKLPTGYDTSQAPALGSGRIDGGARLAVGRGFGAVYLSGEVAYRARGGRSNEFPSRSRPGSR